MFIIGQSSLGQNESTIGSNAENSSYGNWINSGPNKYLPGFTSSPVSLFGDYHTKVGQPYIYKGNYYAPQFTGDGVGSDDIVIHKFDKDGNFVETVATLMNTGTTFSPKILVMDDNGYFYCPTDGFGHGWSIYIFNPDGSFNRTVGYTPPATIDFTSYNINGFDVNSEGTKAYGALGGTYAFSIDTSSGAISTFGPPDDFQSTWSSKQSRMLNLIVERSTGIVYVVFDGTTRNEEPGGSPPCDQITNTHFQGYLTHAEDGSTMVNNSTDRQIEYRDCDTLQDFVVAGTEYFPLLFTNAIDGVWKTEQRNIIAQDGTVANIIYKWTNNNTIINSEMVSNSGSQIYNGFFRVYSPDLTEIFPGLARYGAKDEAALFGPAL